MREFGPENASLFRKEKGGSLLRSALQTGPLRELQSVQRRSERSLIWRSEAAWKLGSGLLTTL